MKRKPSFISSIHLFSLLSILLISLSFLLFEMGFYINSSRKREEELESSFYEDQKLHLKSEIDRIARRQEFQIQTVESKALREVETRSGEAYAIVSRYYERMSPEASREEIESSLAEILRSVSYRGGDSYYFILDSGGRVVMNRGSPFLEGESIEALQDGSGKYMVREMIELARNKGGGPYTYLWFRERDGLRRREMKTGYVRYFAPLDWIIGTSIFQADIVGELQGSLLSNIEHVYSERPDYIFIRGRDGTILNGPDRGKNVFTDRDKEQSDVFLRMVKAVEGGDGFIQFECRQNRELMYLAYVRDFPEWDWLIGARVTTEELREKILAQKKELNETLGKEFLKITLMVLLFGLLTLLLLRRLGRNLTGDLFLFSEFFKEAARDNVLMDEERLRYREFTELGSLANVMTRENIQAEGERQRNRNLESLGYLAGGIAHDFNNCLMGIYGNIELAQGSLDEPEEARTYLENSLESMEKARKLTGRLLTFSHGGTPDPTRIPLLPLLEKVMAPYRKIEGIGLSLPEPEGEIFLWGDENQISLILEQVTANAREALIGGRGKIQIRLEREYLEDRFSCHLTGDFIRMEVEDDGAGIDGDDIFKIFDPYYSTKQVGRGLGLATVFSIIHQHGGHVEAHQAPERGMVISLYFPAPPKEAGSAGPV